MTETSPPARGSGRCPVCGKPVDRAWRPFCSKRCADVDLGRWFGEAYRIPAVDAPDDGEADPSPDEPDDPADPR
jgi:hypothetical protein